MTCSDLHAVKATSYTMTPTLFLWPLVLLATSGVCSLGAGLGGMRSVAGNEHWTSLAQKTWPARMGLQMAALYVPLATGVLLYRTTAVIPAVAMATAAYGGVSLAGYRLQRALFPWLTWKEYWLARVLHVVRAYSWLMVVLILAPLCSTSFDARTALVLLVAGLMLPLYWAYGIGWAERLLGLSIAAPADLTALSAALCERLGIPVARIWVVRTRVPQAYAYFGSHAIAVSEGALRSLSRDQQEAILAHELGHLTASLRTKVLYFLGGLPLFGLVAYRPIVNVFGFPSYVALAAACWYIAGASSWLARGMDLRALEKQADHVAQRTVGQERYARALERLYELSLIPVVLDDDDSPSHASLFDRMRACGVVPEYSRPQPPSTNARTVTFLIPLLGTLALAWALVRTGLIR